MNQAKYNSIAKQKEWCDDCAKVKFLTESLAKASAAHLTRIGLPLEIYRCPMGGGWHQTSKK